MSHPANPALPVTNAIDVARHAQSDMRLPRQPRCARIAGQRPVRHLYGPRRCSFRVMALIKTVVVTGWQQRVSALGKVPCTFGKLTIGSPSLLVTLQAAVAT